VSEVVEEMRTLALQKRHSLHADLAEDLRPIGYDRDEFKRMLKHLLHNAIAYTPEGGAITVTTRNSDGQVEIMVSDTGMGIAPADQPLVFERFYRADQARSASTGGVGVGLTIARKIAQAHGGTVDLSSEVDKGTMVRIRIPTMAQRSPGSAPVKA
jgi:signal transduction histidine kinase